MNKGNNVRLTIMRRELAAWFSSPVAYITAGIFLVFSGFLFFSTFFLVNRAELRNFFGILPVMFAFFVPAITMRLFAEEARSGSLETLMTLPVSGLDVTVGKFLAAFISGASVLVPTLAYAVTAAFLGEPEWGPIAGGYLGALFLIASFTAIGLFASSLTKNQIVAFFVAFAVSILLAMIDRFLVILPAAIVAPLEYLSAGYHFESVSRGIIDTRDIVYFLSLTSLFLALTVRAVEGRRAA
ncbi:MAG TPA: ABC transporter permease subunit [Treponemataceae bacterium]|nr:ABC transporter permease subunit [Treponemataceae bacterium]